MPLNIPGVIEQDARGSREQDLFSRLLKDRIIILGEEVDDQQASIIVGSLLFLEKQDPDRDIEFYVNSPGGSVTAGLAIYDTMQLLRCDVATICMGMAASMGAVLLAGGAKGKRFALPNARVMIHQVSAGFRGTAGDIDVQAREILKTNDQLARILQKHTNQDLDKIKHDIQRDYFLSSEESVAYGLIDEVLVRDKR
ncbi:ATP-dependent Clp protease proteolytic subunit [Armatimonas sp.]|uniref:ATP-dependent Clp protease proteolytic subunit n=1 Tax=Armatimonas sp. TaxID=1872638 RepID=UPI00286CB582|nr:ATP-dependent Clp protease proteolytic subunit [Armatimonas sp.]